MNLTLIVEEIRQLTDRIRLFTLADEHGGNLPAYTAGSHIDIHMDEERSRSYSLIDWSQPSAKPTRYSIAVQREDAGDGGSMFMHSLTTGQHLSVVSPRNTFELADQDSDSILIAGGIGVTPILSMAATLHEQRRSFHCHYTGRSRTEMALLTQMEAHFGPALSVYTDDQMPLNLKQLIKQCDPAAHLYMCGPKGLIEAVRANALAAGFSVEQLHIELFTTSETQSTDQSFEVELRSTGQVFLIPVGKSIIDVLDAEGVDLIYDCQRGDCGICQTDVVSGIPDHRDLVLSDDERDSGKVMQICVSRAKSDRLVLDI